METGGSIGIYLKLFLTAVFWGGTFIAGKILARDVGPFSAAFLRFVVASIPLLAVAFRSEGGFVRPTFRQWVALTLLAMTGLFAYNFFFFTGLKVIEANRAAVIVASNPIAISLLSCLIFKEKLEPVKLAGIIISVTGAIIVISRGSLSWVSHGSIGWGELCIFCCVLSWSAYSLIGKTVMNGLSPLVSVSYSTVIGASALFIPAYVEGVTKALFHYSPDEWMSILYLGIFGTVISFVWYYEGIKAIGPTRASQFINFVPISGVMLAYFMLSEPITRSLAIGALLVLSGVYMANKHSTLDVAPLPLKGEGLKAGR